ncbi:MAG: hypothetical protein IT382_19835 [Deltaproteobacteria bacterium]|nr:hypothetical protein [Deltaproteobacteria bacterium]
MNRIQELALALMLAVSTTACVSTSTNLSSTGEPLEARIATTTATVINRGTRYEPGQYQWLEGLYQGTQKIDDELNFYHVAGDAEKEADIIQWRNEHNRGIVASWAGFGVGAGVLLGGVGYMFGSTGGDQAQLEALLTRPEGQVTLGVVTAGGILLGAAPFMYSFLGPDQTIIVEFPAEGSWTYELVYPRTVAQTVAAEYNAKLASSASGSRAAAAGAGAATTPSAASATPPVAPPATPPVTSSVTPPAAPTPAVAVPAAPQLTLARTKFKVGEEIAVTFAQPVVAPTGQQYWLTLVAADAADSEYGSWHYVAANAVTDKLVAERAGTFEVRLHDLYPQNKAKVLQRVRVVVK